MLPARRAPVGLDCDVLVVLAEPGSALLAFQLIREEPDVLSAYGTFGHAPTDFINFIALI